MKGKEKPNRIFNFGNILLVLLILLIPIQTLTSMRHNSLYGDEAYHISSGYSKLVSGDYRLLPEDGPLQPVISALPLLFLNVSFPFGDASWKVKNMDVLMPKFLFEYNSDPYLLVFWSRVPMIILSMILGYYVYRWAKELFGKKAGLFALFLYTFSPDMLAHSQISSSDFGFAVFGVIALYYLWRYLKSPSWTSLILSGLTMGLVQLTKFSAIFLVPIYAIILLTAAILKPIANTTSLRARGKTPVKGESGFAGHNTRIRNILIFSAAFVAVLLIAYLVILMAYKFEGVGTPLAESIRNDIHINRDVYHIEDLYQSNPILKFLFEKIPSPLPYYFVRGLGYSIVNSHNSNPSLVVDGSLQTEPYFFIYAFFVKTPIPLLIFLLMSIIFFSKLKKDWASEAVLIVPFLVYHLAFCFTTKQFGYRYLIHTVPLVFIFASRIVNLKFEALNGKKIFLSFILILSAWYVISSLFIYPHYLSYFNEFIGPANAYHYMVDSNMDWGQDLFYLRDYVHSNNVTGLKLDYYGFPVTVGYGLPAYYGIDYQNLTCGRTQGMIAISVTKLMGNQSCYGWLLAEKPAYRAGYTIIVYNITNAS